MDINRVIYELKQNAVNLENSICVVNNAVMTLDEIENLGWNEFGMRSKYNMPPKLYKYFPNFITIKEGKQENYSIQALRDNTVYLSSPTEFDDVYDSDINLELSEYEKYRLKHYCEICGLEFEEKDTPQEMEDAIIRKLFYIVREKGDLKQALIKEADSELEKLSDELFVQKMLVELANGNDFGKALSNVIVSDYSDFTKSLRESFRVACFTTTPFSQLMWGGSYADCHRGFCIEYSIPSDISSYKDVFLNLFPLVYCKVRPEMSERLVRMQDKIYTNEALWDIYFHGVLRKSIDWMYQNEWRLVLPRGIDADRDYNIKFFPISRVFIGNRMESEKRRDIIDICNEKSIPYVGVTRNSSRYEMQACKFSCEECQNIFP
ncbi:MAG: DUF2971 domain-containing protein [Lachnospiraceae bacterium]|nr:DUF2971 domain-containing protein [Lachnospiraceae bacterium]